MPGRLHRGVAAVASLILLALFLACAGGTQPSKENKERTDDEKGKKAEAGKSPPGKPDFTLTAEEFTSEFLADAKAADEKYKGKVVEITGNTRLIGGSYRDGVKTVHITLDGVQKKGGADTLISIRVRPEFHKAALEMSKNQKVQIIGEYEDWSLGFSAGVSNATLKVYGKSQLFDISAADLAAEFTRDAKAAINKYADKEMVVEGEVEEVTFKSGRHYAKLKGDGTTRISLGVVPEDVPMLKKGRIVRLRGEALRYLLFKNNEVYLSGGCFMEGK
jgi:hypothetical protein